MLAEVREQAKTILGLEAVSAIERASAGTLSKIAALTAAIKAASAPRATTRTAKPAPRPAVVQPAPAANVPAWTPPAATAKPAPAVPDFSHVTTRPSDEVLFALAERTFGAELFARLKMQWGQAGLRCHCVAAFRESGIVIPGLRGEMGVELPESLKGDIAAAIRK